MASDTLTTLCKLSGRGLLTLVAGLIAPNAPAVEVNSTDPKPPTVWYCELLEDELHHVACSPSRPNALPWQLARGPNGHPLLDSLDELLLVQEESDASVQGKRFVPLFSVPYDVGSVETLARAALCKRDPACSIEIADPGFL